jgi:hypothetical protein
LALFTKIAALKIQAINDVTKVQIQQFKIMVFLIQFGRAPKYLAKNFANCTT